jgi:futalosine hydrolase
MKIWIVSATEAEFSIAHNAHIAKTFKSDNTIEWFVIGVGIVPSVFNLMLRLKADKPDLIINVGIAGAIDKKIHLGETLLIQQDEFFQWGAEDIDGFLDVFTLGFVNPNEKPFKDGKLYASGNYLKNQLSHLRKVNGITVQKVHGNQHSISQLQDSCTGIHVESMEGAAVLYVAEMLDIPAIQIRSISNYVEPRNRENWKIKEAIENLNYQIINILST